MKVDFSKNFKGFNGEEVKANKSIGYTLAQGLFNGYGVGNTPEDKFAAYKLCNRLMNETGEIELDKDERKLIKESACAGLTPGAFGQVMELLNEKEA